MMKNRLNVAFAYAIAHMCLEIVCFQMLYAIFLKPNISFYVLAAIIYDFVAFVPQFAFGYLFDRGIKIRIDIIGALLLVIAVLMVQFTDIGLVALLIMSVGNAIIHATGAEVATLASNGRLSHSAVVVAGGSFGVVIGRTMGMGNVSPVFCLIPIAVIIIIMIAFDNVIFGEDKELPTFDIVKSNYGVWTVIGVAFVIIIARAYIGYAIPMGWKKELWQTFCLFFFMGFGKAFGGLLSDRFGVAKVGVVSTLASIPLLIFGNEYMIISILGVFLFSFTMSITFGMILSVLRELPGVAFGITTIGLFIGSFPMLIGISFGAGTNCIIIVAVSLFSAFGLWKLLK